MAGERFQILAGDVLERLREMPSNHYCGLLSDVPYGLGTREPTVEELVAYLTGSELDMGGDFMGRKWKIPPVAVWREVYRVLKPGAHLLVFGGTRTQDLITLGMRAAGFEIRDCLQWLYAAAMPKSLDVSKAIDKAKGNRAEILRVTEWIRQARDAAGLGNAEIDEHFGTHGMAGHWTSSGSQPAVPTTEQWERLVVLLGATPPEDIAELAARINREKGQPGDAWFKREVVGRRTDGAGGSPVGLGTAASMPREYDVTAPAQETSEQWDGQGTALKPAYEPCILARKPLEGTVVQNVLKWGCGALAIDDSRLGFASSADEVASKAKNQHATHDNGARGQGVALGADNRPRANYDAEGRYPSNVLLSHGEGCRKVGTRKVRSSHDVTRRTPMKSYNIDHTADVGNEQRSYGDENGEEDCDDWSCEVSCPIRVLDEQSGERPGMSGGGAHAAGYGGGMFGGIDSTSTARGDTGGASRFFFCAKASRAERELGCELLPTKLIMDGDGPPPLSARPDRVNTSTGRKREAVPARNHGPCVKPLKLTRYLAGLILPPVRPTPRRLLVTYAGTGSEVVGAMRAGWDEVVGIELEDGPRPARTKGERDNFVAIARARIERWLQVPIDMDEGEACSEGRAAVKEVAPEQVSLFGAKTETGT